MFYGLVSVLCCVWSVSCSRHEFIWQGLHWCSPPPGWLVACCSWNKQYQYEAAPCYASEVSRVMHASLAPKWVKLSQNGKNPGLFQIRFRYILAQCAKMYRNLIWKSPGFFPFWDNLTHFGAKTGNPESSRVLQKGDHHWLNRSVQPIPVFSPVDCKTKARWTSGQYNVTPSRPQFPSLVSLR